MQGKACRDCKRVKPASEFYKRGKGLTSYCKVCHGARVLATRAKNPDHYKAYRNPNVTPEKQRATMLRLRYGMTVADYDTMLKSQGGGCAICGAAKNDRKHLAVDHCHATGKVRGILCFDCNVALGKAGDDPERLRTMAEYLTVFFTKELEATDEA